MLEVNFGNDTNYSSIGLLCRACSIYSIVICLGTIQVKGKTNTDFWAFVLQSYWAFLNYIRLTHTTAIPKHWFNPIKPGCLRSIVLFTITLVAPLHQTIPPLTPARTLEVGFTWTCQHTGNPRIQADTHVIQYNVIGSRISHYNLNEANQITADHGELLLKWSIK